MNYILNIDWLTLYCHYSGLDDFAPYSLVMEEINETFAALKRAIPESSADLSGAISFRKQAYGTRQFRNLYHVYIGKEKFAEVQMTPHSPILDPRSVMVKIENRRLYTEPKFIDINIFLKACKFSLQSISRIDLAADFRKFAFIDCGSFIAGVMDSTYRHIGRGAGAAYFVHGSVKTKAGNQGLLKYNGLSYGANSSACRVYLYNKTLELLSVKDKPWIRDAWTKAGLISDLYYWHKQDVWRLEVSIKTDGMKVKTPQKESYKISYNDIQTQNFDPQSVNLETIYFSFIKRKFKFIRNRPNIPNISREPVLQLFGAERPTPLSPAPRNVTGGNRTERIVLKFLWNMCEEYRALDNEDDQGRNLTQELSHDLASSLAKATDLLPWLQERRKVWETPNHI